MPLFDDLVKNSLGELLAELRALRATVTKLTSELERGRDAARAVRCERDAPK